MPDPRTILDFLESVDGLPSPPQVALKIVEISRDPEKGIGDLTDVLQHDPALTAKILKISNSASYARGREISTLLEAASLLGANSLSVVALGFSLKNAMPGFQHDDLTDAVIWRHSVATGVACRKLARMCGKSNSETAFLCGLMARIGQLVFLALTPDHYLPVVESSTKLLPSADEERDVLGLTHHQAGRLLLDRWELPPLVRDVVEHWIDEDQSTLSDEARQLSSYVRLGDAIRALIFEDDKAEGLKRFYSLAADLFGMPEGEVDRLFLSCQQELQETIAVFEDRVTDVIECDQILAMAREQMVNVGLQLANNLAETTHKAESLTVSNQELEKRSSTDALTNLPNRFALDRELSALDVVSPQATAGRSYSIVMLDIDHFKTFNDTHGHVAGDQVLQSVGSALAESARATDFVARYGGEEFTVILANCGVDEAVSVADRFRQAIERRGIELGDKTVSVTASLGVASSDSFAEGTSHHEILTCADEALYQAKKLGRNRVVSHESGMSQAKL